MSKPNHARERLETAGPNGTLPSDKLATSPNGPGGMQAQVNRPVSAGPSHRGDRRDTHPSFSTGKGGNRDGGRSGPLGAAGRKSGPKSTNRPGGGE
jgi:hypothetical protein